MACINCGVITSAWDWRNSSRCESAIKCTGENWSDSCLFIPDFCRRRPQFLLRRCTNYEQGGGKRFGLQPEFLAEIEPADIGVVDDVVGAALHQHFAGIDDVG